MILRPLIRALVLLPVLGLAPFAGARADALDDAMHRAMHSAHIPGMAVAVVRGGRLVRTSSYGVSSLEYEAPVKATTPFEIASAGKIYTAVLLMRLVDAHRIDLDASVGRYVPGLPAQWQAITVRNLATHMSGLGDADIRPGTVETLDAVKQAFSVKVVSPPGQRSDYAGFDYTLLQLALETVGGKPFAQLMRDEVIQPAGLQFTAFDNARDLGPQRVADPIPGRADYYRWVDGANQRRWFLYAKYAYAAGGIYSCAADMARLLARIDAGDLLTQASRAALETPTPLPRGGTADFAVGWATGLYRGHRWVGHSGGPAFADVMYFPDDHVGVVVFTNQQKLSPRLAARVADEFIPAPPGYFDPTRKDEAPALTQVAQQVLAGAAIGKVPADLFAPDVGHDFLDDLNDIGPVGVGLFGPLDRLILEQDSLAADGSRTRHYRAVFGSHAVGFDFGFDASGRVVSVNSGGD
jgi:CubicO group peptidase (beta-lactamase class C family)